ncbi:unnamed protein product [Cuscuta campestris]|uniref:Uncharacterized protein n=1 Tax=Cuscuta campestris TaxID=132261 RepID=A0A484M3M8_9ASTE|nr:unnamed protein product [Cuscuta campestris]
MTMKMAAESAAQNSSNLILAAERTRRRDPTDNFRYYNGGWNLSNPHYFASTGYASLGPFVTAVLWFIIFPMWVFCMCIRCCCCPRKTYGYSRHAYNLSLIFLILLTIAVIAGGVFIFVGQARFEKSISNLISYVLHRVDTVVGNIMDLFNNMLAAKDVGVGQISLPEKQKNDVDQIGSTINGVYQSFRDFTTKSGNDVISYLNPLKLILITLATIVILVAFLGLCMLLSPHLVFF